MTGITPGDTIMYRVGETLNETWQTGSLMSETFYVKIPPKVGEKVTLAVFGDMGHAKVDSAKSWQVRLHTFPERMYF